MPVIIDKAFAKRAGVRSDYQRGMPKLCQVTRFLGQFQVLPYFIQCGARARGSGGLKKSPRALRAWRAKAGDNFFKIFFGSFFPSTGKK